MHQPRSWLIRKNVTIVTCENVHRERFRYKNQVQKQHWPVFSIIANICWSRYLLDMSKTMENLIVYDNK